MFSIEVIDVKNTGFRILIYIIGLFINALGIVMSASTGLGVACVTCFCTNLSNFLGITLGNAFTTLYVFYVFLEFVMLRKDFGVKNLLQLCFAFILGFFTDFIKSFLVLTPQGLIQQLVLLIVSLWVIALSVVILINCDLVPSAPDGFVQVLSSKLKKEFGNVKVFHDIIIASLGVLIGFLYGQPEGLGIATVIAALTLGKMIGFLEIYLKKPIRTLCGLSVN